MIQSVMVIHTQVDEAKAAEAVSPETPRKDKEETEVDEAEAETRRKCTEETEHETKSMSIHAPGREECTLPISILATKTVVGLYFR